MSEPQIDIENLLQQDKERLSQEMDNAIKHAPRIQIIDGNIVNEEHQMKMEKSSDVPPGMAHLSWSEEPNKVYLDERNSHLFPWLYSEALKKAGIEPTQEKVESLANHEFSHLAKAQRLEGIKSRIGVSFYKVTSVDGRVLPHAVHGVQPSVSMAGECLIEEFAEIINSPGEDMSAGDKRDISRLEKLTEEN